MTCTCILSSSARLVYMHVAIQSSPVGEYGVATISRLLKIIGLLCKRALLKRLYSAKETCNIKGLSNTTLHLWYGVATIGRHLKIIGLLCKRALSKRRCSAQETYNFNRLLIVATPHLMCGIPLSLYVHILRAQRHWRHWRYGVATISRLIKIIGLFCRI